jgi:hypothetical protein
MRPIGLGILVIVMTGEIGCIAPKPGNSLRSGAPVNDEPLVLDPGAVGVTTADRPAVWSYDPPRGQILSAADGAGAAARTALETTLPEQPDANLFVSAVGFAGAPVAAVIGGMTASRSRLSQDKLAESEAGLTEALAAMAQQNLLRDRIITAAKAAGHRRFVALASSKNPAGERANGESAAAPRVGTVLETRVEELRLERKGDGDSTFALRIKARVRMVRPNTGQVLSDTAFEYLSGEELFLDWTLNHGEPLQKCTDTGYRQIAAEIVQHLINITGETPILIGAGAPPPSRRTLRPPVMLAAQRRGPTAPPPVQFAAYSVAEPGTIYVYPAAPAERITVQRPLTKDEAVSEALANVEWSLDGLDQHPNVFVSLTAIAAAIPMSLYQQTAGAVRGLSEKKFRTADSQVTAAVRTNRPTAALAREIAQTLSPRCAGSVVLLDQPRSHGAPPALVRFATGKPMPVNWPGNPPMIRRAGDQALEIEVLSAALQGGEGVNPPLAVHLIARATLSRADDGREIYSCPVQYRGTARKFTDWAANDAKLFREELDRCYRELSDTVIDQMVARRLIVPGDNPNSFLAGNAN